MHIEGECSIILDMEYNKDSECSIYYAHHISSKVGAFVTTFMLSAILLLFIIGRSTLDYSSLHLPEKEEKTQVMSIKIHTLTEEQISAIVQDAPVEKKRVVQKKRVQRQEPKKKVYEHAVQTKSVDAPLAHEVEHSSENVSTTPVVEEKQEPMSVVPSAPPVVENTPTEIEKAIASVLQAIEKNKTYPRAARRAGYEGTVHIQIMLNTQGVITECSLHKTSGYALLDNATLDVIRKLYGKKVTNADLKTTMEAIIPIRYSLQS